MLHLARYSSITPSDFDKALGITVGFDSMFDRLFGDVERSENQGGFPPYNIRKDEENMYTIEMAVAGFSKEDLEAELKEGVLTVRSKTDQEEGEYLHRGIPFLNLKVCMWQLVSADMVSNWRQQLANLWRKKFLEQIRVFQLICMI